MIGQGGGRFAAKKPDKKPGAALVIPKPINLPSRRKENNGFDPNIQLVAGGSWAGGAKPRGPGQAPQTNGPAQANARIPPPYTSGAAAPSSYVSASSGVQSRPIPPSNAPSNGPSRPTEYPKLGDFPKLGDEQDRKAWGGAGQQQATTPRDDVFNRNGDHNRVDDSNRRSSMPEAGERRSSGMFTSAFTTNDWAEDDEDEMDFNKPIVIQTGGDQQSAPSAAPKAAVIATIDPLEEARILAKKKQQELERMQEQLLEQQRRADMEAFERQQRSEQEEEDRRKREAEQQRMAQEEARMRYAQERQAMEERRRKMEEERRRDEETMREKEKEKEEEQRRRHAEFSKQQEELKAQKERELELAMNQNQLMKQSMEAARLRRQHEEERLEAERKAGAQDRLRELERKRVERDQALQEAREAEQRAKEREREEALQQERLAMEERLRQKAREEQAKPRHEPAPVQPPANPWTRHEAAPSAEAEQDRRDFPSLRDDEEGSGVDREGRGQYSAMSRERQGGERGPRKLYDPKHDRFVTEGEEPGFLRKQMAEREAEREAQDRRSSEAQQEREARLREREARLKYFEETKAQDLANREPLKKEALAERRKREAETKAREQELQLEESQNADPQRMGGKGRVMLRREGDERQAGDDRGEEWSRGGGPKVRAQPGRDLWDSPYNTVSTWTAAGSKGWSGEGGTVSLKQILGEEARNSALAAQQSNSAAAPKARPQQGLPQQQQHQQQQGGRPFGQPERAVGEADNRKMQDASEVATGAADFILGGDDEQTQKRDSAQEGFVAAEMLPAAPVAPNPALNAAPTGWAPANAAGWAVPSPWDGGLGQKTAVNYETAFSAPQFASVPLGLGFLPAVQQRMWTDSSALPGGQNNSIAGGPLFSGSGLPQETRQWNSQLIWSAQEQSQVAAAGDALDPQAATQGGRGGAPLKGKAGRGEGFKQTPGRGRGGPKREGGLVDMSAEDQGGKGGGPTRGGGRGGASGPGRGRGRGRGSGEGENGKEGDGGEGGGAGRAAGMQRGRGGPKVMVPAKVRQAAEAARGRGSEGEGGAS